jgi:hypothetical protein
VQLKLTESQPAEQLKRSAVAGTKPGHQDIGVQDDLGQALHGIANNTILRISRLPEVSGFLAK